MKQLPSPEQLYLQRVAHAIELFYGTLPEEHRRLIQEMADAEYITALQLVSKVWAKEIARYLQAVAQKPTREALIKQARAERVAPQAVAQKPIREELVKLQEQGRAEQVAAHVLALVAQQMADHLKDHHAIKEPYGGSEVTEVVLEPINAKS
jgi:uncharacterized protein YdiU (UPF0061 family)